MSDSTRGIGEPNLDADEQLVGELARLLDGEVVPPLGLEVRLHAAVRRHRHAARDAHGLRAVGASLVFSAAAFRGDAAAVVAALLIALAYAALIVPYRRAPRRA